MDFIGKVCPYCKTEFTEDDDIVVCSVCEMPHHKECWIENNGCTTFGCTGTIVGVDKYNEGLNEGLYCKKCGSVYTEGQVFCSSCGERLVADNSMENKAYNVNHEQNFYESDKDESNDMKTFIGSSSSYYINKFNEIEYNNGQIKWNWAAFFFNIYWVVYRKMYVLATIMLFVELLFELIIDDESMSRCISFIISILCGMYGNHFYMKHAEKHVQAVKYMDITAKERYLKSKGGTSVSAVIGFLAIFFIIGFIIGVLEY